MSIKLRNGVGSGGRKDQSLVEWITQVAKGGNLFSCNHKCMEGEEQKKVAEEMYFSAGGIWSVIMTVVAFVLELEMPLWSELCGLIKFHWKKEKVTKKKEKGVRTAKSFPFFSALHHPLAHRFVRFRCCRFILFTTRHSWNSQSDGRATNEQWSAPCAPQQVPGVAALVPTHDPIYFLLLFRFV